MPSCLFKPEVEVDRDAQRTKLSVVVRIKRHDGRRVLVSPDGRDLLTTVTPAGEPIQRPYLVRAIAQAYMWKAALMADPGGVTIRQVAAHSNLKPPRVKYLLPLANLAPAIVHAVASGSLPRSVSLKDLVAVSEHLDWQKQVRLLGLGR